jgi:putative flippase GtrA
MLRAPPYRQLHSLMRGFVWKLLQYAVTGGIAAIVDAGGFVLLVYAGVSIVVAGCLSFCVAAVVNYNLSSKFVFNREATPGGFVRFMAAALIGLVVNNCVTLTGVFMVGLPPLAAKLAGIAIAFLVNFLLNLRIVFR